MTWELREVEDVECTLDNSEVQVIVHRIVDTITHKEYTGTRVRVRADLLGREFTTPSGLSNRPTEPVPIVSFIGTANNVRKHLITYMLEYYGPIMLSHEHASYIGYELLRAETDPQYVQV